MSDKQNIEAAFARANVPLKISERTLNRRIVRGAGQMVEMAIIQGNGGETISMVLPDGEDADVRVIGGDPDLQQVVVMVKEPERVFTERNYNWKTRKHEEVSRKVPKATRKFLVGMDECHLFIAQMNGSAKGTSVKQVHEDLRPREVPKPKQAKKLKIKRTGEWFLIPATKVEVESIEGHTKTFGVRKKVGIGSLMGRMRGRPHVVTESVIVSVPVRPGSTNVARTEFVRGRILHPDHKVVKLKTWHRVIMNTEDRTAGSQWVD
jgi:hypothetical protein